MKKTDLSLFAKHLAYLIGIIALATCVSILLRSIGVGKENALMVFLVGVLTVTVLTRGYVYSIAAAFFSVLIFNFFFTSPVRTLRMNNTGDIILLFFFLSVSLIAASLTSRLQTQAELAQKSERMTKLLFDINEGFLNVTGKENAINLALSYIHKYTGHNCSVSIIKEDKTYYNWESEETDLLSLKDDVLELPVKSGGKELGKVRIYENNSMLTDNEKHIAKSITYQLAIILDREFIYKERESIKIAMEREHIKSNFLRAISHDLRTPLTAIVGASSLLAESCQSLDLESIKKLAEDINEESLWLTRIVENILNMTKIDEGKLKISKTIEVVDDVVNEAISHVPGLISSDRFSMYLPDRLVSFPMDGTLIVQVLTNLLDNAMKHTDEKTKITLRVYTDKDNAVFEVEDNGPGIDHSIRKTLFESFVKGSSDKSADSRRGIGLGLAICKAIVNAHGGNIFCSTPEGGGTMFRFTLPMGEGEDIYG